MRVIFVFCASTILFACSPGTVNKDEQTAPEAVDSATKQSLSLPTVSASVQSEPISSVTVQSELREKFADFCILYSSIMEKNDQDAISERAYAAGYLEQYLNEGEYYQTGWEDNINGNIILSAKRTDKMTDQDQTLRFEFIIDKSAPARDNCGPGSLQVNRLSVDGEVGSPAVTVATFSDVSDSARAFLAGSRAKADGYDDAQ